MQTSKYMQIALRLSKRNVGLTYPNPSVGCVIVEDDKIISTGVTAIGGRPHAEAIAISKAGKALNNATAYVTLEPCSFKGVTPSCADTIIKAGIRKVVVATIDPYMKVSGRGIKKMQSAGIDVLMGDGKKQAKEINEGFFTKIGKKRPFITLKLATSNNEKIADKNGYSKWITNAKTREYAHLLRAKNDAILVGSGTVLQDDPTLNCRLCGMSWASPTRIIMDRKLQIPEDSNIFKTAKDIPTYIISYKNTRASILPRFNIKNIVIDNDMSLKEVLQKISNVGITRILVEGGSQIAASFIDDNLVDKIIWMKSDKILDSDGVDAVKGFCLKDVCNADNFKLGKQFNIDSDIVSEYERNY